MKLSIVIPCYNEVSTINSVIDKVLSISLEIEREVVIVDDCSTDGTREHLQSIKDRDKRINMIFHDKNQGKGAALRTAFKAVSGDIVNIKG